jgi:translation initiation factor IF-3
MDFGKYRYEQTKQERSAKKKQHAVKNKEIKYRPSIEEHDYQTKMKSIKAFLEKGSKIKITLAFRGREMAHLELGQRLLDRISKDVEGSGAVESRPRLMGRFYTMVVAPNRSH